MSTPGMGARALHGFEADPPSPWMTKAEVAAYLRVTDRTVDRWVSEGRLAKHKLPGIQSVRFARAEVEGLISSPTS